MYVYNISGGVAKNYPFIFLLFYFKLETNLDNKFAANVTAVFLLIRLNLLYICKDLKNKVIKVNFYQFISYFMLLHSSISVQIKQNAVKFKIALRKHESIFNFFLPITRGP